MEYSFLTVPAVPVVCYLLYVKRKPIIAHLRAHGKISLTLDKKGVFLTIGIATPRRKKWTRLMICAHLVAALRMPLALESLSLTGAPLAFFLTWCFLNEARTFSLENPS